MSRRWQNYANVSLWRPLYYVKTMVKQCYIKWLRPHCNVKLWCQNLVISWSNDRGFCICSSQNHCWTCAPAQNAFVAPTLGLACVGTNFSQTWGWKLRAFELLGLAVLAFADAGIIMSILPLSLNFLKFIFSSRTQHDVINFQVYWQLVLSFLCGVGLKAGWCLCFGNVYYFMLYQLFTVLQSHSYCICTQIISQNN